MIVLSFIFKYEYKSDVRVFALKKGAKQKLIKIGQSVLSVLIASEMKKIGHYEWRYIEDMEKAILEIKILDGKMMQIRFDCLKFDGTIPDIKKAIQSSEDAYNKLPYEYKVLWADY